MTVNTHQRIAQCWALYIDAKRLLALSDRIAERSQSINELPFAGFFGGLQKDYGSLTLLRIAALYDTHRSGNTHSLPHLLDQ